MDSGESGCKGGDVVGNKAWLCILGVGGPCCIRERCREAPRATDDGRWGMPMGVGFSWPPLPSPPPPPPPPPVPEPTGPPLVFPPDFPSFGDTEDWGAMGGESKQHDMYTAGGDDMPVASAGCVPLLDDSGWRRRRRWPGHARDTDGLLTQSGRAAANGAHGSTLVDRAPPRRLLREVLASAGAQAPCWECRAPPGTLPGCCSRGRPHTYYYFSRAAAALCLTRHLPCG